MFSEMRIRLLTDPHGNVGKSPSEREGPLL